MTKIIKFYLTLFLFGSFTGLQAQEANQCVSTNTDDWTFAVDLDGNPTTWNPGAFTGTPIEIPDGCLDPAIIDCICPGQNDPSVATCDEALEIWAEDFQCIDNVPCSYPPNRIFYFQRNFDFSDSCHVIDSFLIQAQADNFMEVRINGNPVLNTFAAGCPSPVPGNVWSVMFSTDNLACFNTNVANALNFNGPNTITVMVQNAGGGCLNYAFLSLCAKFWTHEEELDASFDIDPTPVPGGDLLSSVLVNHPDLYHEWYFMSGPNDSGPWTPVGFIPNSFNFINYFAETCIHYRVIHRVALSEESNCEACFDVLYHKCVKGKSEGDKDSDYEIKVLAEIDCKILGEYDWPTTGKPEGLLRNTQEGNLHDTQIQIYPIPTHDVLKISWKDLDLTAYSIMDINGAILRQQTMQNEEKFLQVDVRNLVPGSYILKFEAVSGEILTDRFIISR